MTKPKRVLFVCIGNSCRSQMAEAFARAYGRDVVAPASAGVYPANVIAPDTMRAMAEGGWSATCGVRTGPGLRTFARMRRSFSSAVQVRANERIAALLAA